MRRLQDLLKRFRRDESGSFLVIFGLLAIVLIATSGAVVDFTYTQTARSRAQTALDAAALALQSKVTDVSRGTVTKADAEADAVTKAQAILTERLGDSTITTSVTSATIDTTNGKIDLRARITVPTAFVQLVGIRSISAQINSQAIRGSRDLEVSVALDVTQSMNTPSTKIAALRTATGNLIDKLVSTSQPPNAPTYSRMALVPYSYGVNVGSTYATTMRGSIVGSTNISGAAWATATTKTISGISKHNPGVVTVNTVTGLANGDWIAITGVNGMTQVNKKAFKVANINTTNKTFELANTNTNTSSYSSYTSGGTVTKCASASCEVTVTTTSAHGLAVNDKVYVTGVNGMTQINITDLTAPWTIDAATSTTFTLSGSLGPAYSAYTSAGKAYCMKYGCTYLNFTNRDGDSQTFTASNGNDTNNVRYCVVERTGTEAFTDAPPSTSLFSIMYPSTANNCVKQTIVPLTSSRTDLHATADNLLAAGSTAGHIGLAWAWYMLSPSPKFNTSSIWPVAPGAYKRANLLKAVILMTDGDFNTAYCSGVISNDSDTVSGTANMINCNAPNGLSKPQAIALCDKIKDPANAIELYTVGFDIGTGNPVTDTNAQKSAQQFLGGCATDSAHFYMAQTATDLDNAFKQIAQKLNSLRLSH